MIKIEFFRPNIEFFLSPCIKDHQDAASHIANSDHPSRCNVEVDTRAAGIRNTGTPSDNDPDKHAVDRLSRV